MLDNHGFYDALLRTSIADPHTACGSVMDLPARLSCAECCSHQVDPIDRSIGLAGSQ
jgi:hypothetical protein